MGNKRHNMVSEPGAKARKRPMACRHCREVKLKASSFFTSLCCYLFVIKCIFLEGKTCERCVLKGYTCYGPEHTLQRLMKKQLKQGLKPQGRRRELLNQEGLPGSSQEEKQDFGILTQNELQHAVAPTIPRAQDPHWSESHVGHAEMLTYCKYLLTVIGVSSESTVSTAWCIIDRKIRHARSAIPYWRTGCTADAVVHTLRIRYSPNTIRQRTIDKSIINTALFPIPNQRGQSFIYISLDRRTHSSYRPYEPGYGRKRIVIIIAMTVLGVILSMETSTDSLLFNPLQRTRINLHFIPYSLRSTHSQFCKTF